MTIVDIDINNYQKLLVGKYISLNQPYETVDLKNLYNGYLTVKATVPVPKS